MKCFKTFVCGCMMAVCAASWAADYTWMSSPADALWNTSSLNWNSGEAWVDGNNAIFGSSSSKTVTLEGNRTAADITVNGYTFNGSSTLSWTGTMTINGTTTINAPLADSGNGLRFAPNAHVFLAGSNAHTGGTYIGGASDVAFGLSAGDISFGRIPSTPQTNIIVTSGYASLYAPNKNVELNANRHILIKDGAWLCLTGQGKRTFTVKGEIRGEILSGKNWPTTTHLKSHVRSDWLSHAILDPGAGHTNDVGTLSSFGWMEIASGVTRVTAPTENATGDGSGIVYVEGNNSSYDDYRGHLVISGGELYAPPEMGFRRFTTKKYANVEINGGKVNMPKTEYLNALESPAKLTISNGGELICREFRVGGHNSGVVNLNNGGKLTVTAFRMDSAYSAVLNLDGGTISRLNNDLGEQVFMGTHRSVGAYANVQCKILAGGAIFEPKSGYPMFWGVPLRSGVASGEMDGGLTVRGGGIVPITVGGSNYNGPTRIEGGASIQCRAYLNALPTNTTLQLASGTKIDFNTREPLNERTTQTVARVEGVGRIFNNQELHVTGGIAPEFDGTYGKLTIQWPCDLNGDFEIKGDANGCGYVEFEQPGLDISNLTIKMKNPSAFSHNANKTTYKILHVPGAGFTGHFQGEEKLNNWRIVYTTNDAYLRFIRGTTLIIR